MTGRLLIALVAAAALTIAPALIEGYYVQRWGTPPNLTGAATQLGSFPRQLGTWTYTEDGEPLQPEVCRELGLAGYLTRTYTNRDSGSTIRILLMVGKSGPLLRHPPYICYANMANEQVGDMTAFQLGDESKSQFNLLEYRRPRSITNDRFLVAYAMASDAAWKAPASPRIEFGSAPMLFKVQLLTPLDPSQTRENGESTLKQFAEEFSVAFHKHMRDTETPPKEKPAG